MSANDELKNVDIIYPSTMQEASADALLICEEFISKLISSKKDIIKIKVNAQFKFIECNDNMIKEYVSLILKNKKINELRSQFIALLHENINSKSKASVLKCIISGEVINFFINEVEAAENFSWEIIREN